MKQIALLATAVLAVSAGLIGCGTGPGQPAKPQTSASINGIWESVGFGYLLHITDSAQYAFYDITPISAVPQRKGPMDDLLPSLSLANDTLTLVQGTITIEFIRKDALPELCLNPVDSAKAHDPLYNFEVFAETVKEHYAFFELNAIDWDALYQQQKSKLSPSATAAALYLIIEETLELLNDNHAFLEATDAVYEALDEEFPEEPQPLDSLPEYGDFPVAQMVAEHHLQEEMTRDSWLMQWGKLPNGMGYLQVKSMWLFADLDVPKARIEALGFVDAYIEARDQLYEADYVAREVAGAANILDRVLEDLANTSALVIDIRFNGGGQDAVSYAILSRFMPVKQQVAKHHFRYGSTHTTTLPVFIEPSANGYAKPVYVLTSPQSGSAAEAMALATMPIAHVKRIGSATLGALSTSLDKRLPNGWLFSISNEVFMDNNGEYYENVGVPVDYELSYPRDRQAFFRSVVDDLDGDLTEILLAVEELGR